jgi:glycosyltransferase involved in cell wall biosynthesis
MALISVVTGTLNRVHILPFVIKNTVESCKGLELVLVDGGSTDGTQEYVKGLNNPRIKLIEIGHRSSYPHFMNEGIKASSAEWVAQWNDDVVLVNRWSDVITLLDELYDAFVFVWREGDITRKTTSGEWIHYCNRQNEMVMNYGLYNKRIFREIGMYNPAYQYYCADGDMLYRTWKKRYLIKVCTDIRVISQQGEKKQAINDRRDFVEYDRRAKTYADGRLPEGLEYLK